tara:strand:+ start:814 stop:1020 length:207 start_codon:yes stop_codon:yes gene_type:complete
MTYQDALSTPTHERKFFILTLINENNKQNEESQKQMERLRNKGAKGTRSSRIGGEQLKSKMRSGEIPN